MASHTDDVFLQHAGALRRLAVRLSGCPQRADDAVQETWVAALQRPRPHNVWGWLETVLRNVVKRQGRDDTRRRARESVRARSDVAGTEAVDVLARQQTLREVTEAVAALPVPLQECVFLRYFEDLPPRAIAQRLGLPVPIVYKRLDRARGLLRQRLRSRRGALAALFGLPTSSLWQLAATTAVLLMSGKNTILAVTAILALASLWAILWTDPGLETAPGGPDRPAAAKANLQGGAVVDSGPERQSVVDEPESEEPSVADLPYEFALDIEVIGDADLPIGGASIRIAPEGLPFNYANTEADGVVRLKWRGRKSSARMVVACSGRGRPLRLHRVTVAAGETGYLRMRGGSNRSVGGQLLVRYAFDSSITWGALPTAPVPRLRFDDDGYAQFQLPLAKIPNVLDQTISYGTVMNLGQVVLEPTSRLVTFETASLDLPQSGNELHVVSGVVRDALGRLAKGAYVSIGESADREGRWSTRTDDQGRFELPEVRGGSWVLRVGGGERGLHVQTIELANGAPLEVEARLDRGLEFHGELLDADGNALAGWEVEIRDPSGRDVLDYTTTKEDGTFSIPNVDDRPLVATVFGPDSEIPCHRFDARFPGRRLVLPVPAHRAKFGSLEFDLRQADGADWNNLDVLLWDEVSGRGVLCENGRRASGLAAGGYRMRVQGIGLGSLDRGMANVRAGEESETGPHFLPAPVSVEPDWKDEAPKDLVHQHELVDAQVRGIGNEPFLGWPGAFRHGGLTEPVELVPGPQRMQ